MEKDENKHRVRKWYAAKGIDGREVSMKEEQAKDKRQESKSQEQPAQKDVHMSDRSIRSRSNMAMRGTSKCHDPETHDEFAGDDVNNCEVAPARVREALNAELACVQVYKKVSFQKRKDVTGKMPVKVRHKISSGTLIPTFSRETHLQLSRN